MLSRARSPVRDYQALVEVKEVKYLKSKYILPEIMG